MAVDSHLPKWLRGRSYEQRQALKRDFKAGVKLLRRFRDGFTPDDGFNLRDLRAINSSRINSAIKAMRELRAQMTFPHKVVRAPKAKDSRRALRQHTSQKIPTGQKLVVVHVQVPEKTKVSVRHGMVRIERFVKDGSVIEQFVYLPHRMRSFDDIADWFDEILHDIPDGLYTMHVARQGQIMEPITRNLWPKELREYMVQYDIRDSERGATVPFASTVVGFRYVAQTLHGALLESKRHRTQREIYRGLAEQRRKEERKRINRRLGRGRRQGRVR